MAAFALAAVSVPHLPLRNVPMLAGLARKVPVTAQSDRFRPTDDFVFHAYGMDSD